MKLILLTNRNVTCLSLSSVQSNLNGFVRRFNIWIVWYHQFYAVYISIITSGIYSVYESCFESDYGTAFIGEPWLFLKTRQIQMWIFVNMIMINVWLFMWRKVFPLWNEFKAQRELGAWLTIKLGKTRLKW